MPEALDHDEIVKNLAQVFGSSFGEHGRTPLRRSKTKTEENVLPPSRAKIAAEFKTTRIG